MIRACTLEDKEVFYTAVDWLRMPDLSQLSFVKLVTVDLVSSRHIA